MLPTISIIHIILKIMLKSFIFLPRNILLWTKLKNVSAYDAISAIFNFFY